MIRKSKKPTAQRDVRSGRRDQISAPLRPPNAIPIRMVCIGAIGPKDDQDAPYYKCENDDAYLENNSRARCLGLLRD